MKKEKCINSSLYGVMLGNLQTMLDTTYKQLVATINNPNETKTVKSYWNGRYTALYDFYLIVKETENEQETL